MNFVLRGEIFGSSFLSASIDLDQLEQEGVFPLALIYFAYSEEI